MNAWKWLAGILGVLVVLLSAELWIADRQLNRINLDRLTN